MNKNWVTVRDKCPQINVVQMAYLFKKKIFLERTDGRTNGRTNRRSNYIMPQILFGGIKTIHTRRNQQKVTLLRKKQCHLRSAVFKTQQMFAVV